MNDHPRFPYGTCACGGPAAQEVTRAGQRMRLCTRCVEPSDWAVLTLTNPYDDVKVFAAHDHAGAILLATRMIEARHLFDQWMRA